MKKRKKYQGNTDRVYDKEYKEWILAVFKRDGFKCILCGSNRRIQAHHITRHADSVSARTNIKNAACLCYECHSKITGNEDAWASTLISKIRGYDEKEDNWRKYFYT